MSNDQIAVDSQLDEELPDPSESEQDIDNNETTDESDDSDEQPEGQDETVEDDSEEVDFNDKVYKLPKEVAEGVKSMRKDYTNKAMDLAEKRKTFELESKFHNENINDIANVMALQGQLNQFKQVDWNALSDADPVLWQKFTSQRMSLESQLNQVIQEVTHKKQQRTYEMQQEIAKQIEASDAALRREIKDWSPELKTKLSDYAVNRLGFSADEFRGASADPRQMKMLNLAYIGDQLTKKQQAPKPKVTAQPKPAATLKTGNNTARKDVASMGWEEYQKWRKKG